MNKNLLTSLTLGVLLSLANHASGSSLGTNCKIIGVEDTPGTSGEGNGDYNDMLASVCGNVTVMSQTAGAMFSNMPTPTQGGTTYSDNHSLDGADLNANFFAGSAGGWLGNPADPGWSSVQEFTGAGESAVPMYLAVSGEVTFTLLAEDAAFSSINELQYDSTSTPSTILTVFTGPNGPGATDTINFGSGTHIELVTTHTGDSSLYKSDVGPQAFSIYEQTPTAAPEPATFGLTGIALLGLGLLRRRLHN